MSLHLLYMNIYPDLYIWAYMYIYIYIYQYIIATSRGSHPNVNMLQVINKEARTS